VRYIKDMAQLKQSEKELVKTVLEYLGLKRIYAWRNNTGATVIPGKERTRFVRYGFKGSSDVIGILPDGRFLAIECKVGKNKVSPAQEEFLDNIANNGGLAIIAYSLDDVIERLK